MLYVLLLNLVRVQSLLSLKHLYSIRELILRKTGSMISHRCLRFRKRAMMLRFLLISVSSIQREFFLRMIERKEDHLLHGLIILTYIPLIELIFFRCKLLQTGTSELTGIVLIDKIGISPFLQVEPTVLFQPDEITKDGSSSTLPLIISKVVKCLGKM